MNKPELTDNQYKSLINMRSRTKFQPSSTSMKSSHKIFSTVASKVPDSITFVRSQSTGDLRQTQFSNNASLTKFNSFKKSSCNLIAQSETPTSKIFAKLLKPIKAIKADADDSEIEDQVDNVSLKLDEGYQQGLDNLMIKG